MAKIDVEKLKYILHRTQSDIQKSITTVNALSN